MRDVYLLAVGKIKDQHVQAIEEEYLKRLTTFKLTVVEVKASSEDREIEGKALLAKAQEICRDGKPYLVLLTEHTKALDSLEFSRWFYHILESRNEKVFLMIGGAEGHGEEILKAAHARLSLSPLTFPHRLVRPILIEQLYRAQTIHQKHPYHK